MNESNAVDMFLQALARSDPRTERTGTYLQRAWKDISTAFDSAQRLMDNSILILVPPRYRMAP
jgi:hypothetical protein